MKSRTNMETAENFHAVLSDAQWDRLVGSVSKGAHLARVVVAVLAYRDGDDAAARAVLLEGKGPEWIR